MFLLILILTTFSIAATAAFFSIYGLAIIFSSIFWPIIIMGTSLEAGKLIAASYLYRQWNNVSTITKTYLLLSIFILMVITSAGIFGFLSMGYQEGSLTLKQQEQDILLLEHEKQELINLKTERLERRKQIDLDIASLPNNYITARKRLMQAYGPELEKLHKDIELYTIQIQEKTNKISSLKRKKIVNEVHVGPIIFIAKAFDIPIDSAIKWMIIMIMFVFDPLAVALTIAINNIIINKDASSENLSVDLFSASEETLKKVLDDINKKTSLTAEELSRRSMIEHLLNKKLIKENIRNPKNT